MPHSVNKDRHVNFDIPIHPSGKISKNKNEEDSKANKIFTKKELKKEVNKRDETSLSTALSLKIRQFDRAVDFNNTLFEDAVGKKNFAEVDHYDDTLIETEKSKLEFIKECDALFDKLLEIYDDQDKEHCREALKDILNSNLWFATVINKRLASPLTKMREKSPSDPIKRAVKEALNWIKTEKFLKDFHNACKLLEKSKGK